MTDHVRVTVEAGVMNIVMNRPDKKNALSQAMYAAMSEALIRAEEDSAVRVVVIRGEGNDFTAGNDLADFRAMATGTLDRSSTRSTHFLQALAGGHKPYVAAVQGVAVGIGVTMLLHCDFVCVADDAKLMTPFVNLGLVPEASSSLLLQARIGYARAYQMFALGEALEGRVAANIGLVNESVPVAQLQERTTEIARKLASRPLGSLKETKKLMRDTELMLAQMAREGEIFSARLKSPEFAEAFQAFSERRPADFTRFS
jgi:enoyl-CoA hydratase/carnithine racemase